MTTPLLDREIVAETTEQTSHVEPCYVMLDSSRHCPEASAYRAFVVHWPCGMDRTIYSCEKHLHRLVNDRIGCHTCIEARRLKDSTITVVAYEPLRS